ncbi:predicted protein [Histoplasma mississippiense (nom. inval.)]|uniref:predicted protein n=1 Tax=Ajellomyces capsulatus (strain NAm1 / WU24) TaxID=2059318 RepID=UPI000157CC86|nr:predicted protein [Histoplasma mississippiense (nom. inval.)]EDN09899.1 predicted protein [Histoplasma mississippiense (nom. inval.)]
MVIVPRDTYIANAAMLTSSRLQTMTGMHSLWNTPILDQMAGTNTTSEPTSSTRKNIYSPMRWFSYIK